MSLGRLGTSPSFNLCTLIWEPGEQVWLCLGQLVTWVILSPLVLCGQQESVFHRGPQDRDWGSGNASPRFR